jgi:prepilin-type N-terminal cleavage/methylation domain-containing protein
MFRKRFLCFFRTLKHRKGFTLTELVVTLAILSVITAISVPSYISWLPRHKLQTSARQIYDDLNLAKFRAVNGNTVAVIIFTPATNTYTIFLDASVPINWALDAGETVIKQNEPLQDGVSITATTFTANTFGFNNRGLSIGLPAAAPYQVRLSNPTGLLVGVDVNTAGGISIVTSTDGWGSWS